MQILIVIRALLSAIAKSNGETQKAAVQTLLEAVKELAATVGLSTSPEVPVDQNTSMYMVRAEHDMAHAGDKMKAIKLIRERTGLDLLDAKRLFEKFYPPSPAVNRGYNRAVIVDKLNKLDSVRWNDHYCLLCTELAKEFDIGFNGEAFFV